MIGKLVELRKRRHLRLDEGDEQSKLARGLRWYHKALLVPALALVLVAGGLVLPKEAQAHHTGYWQAQDWSTTCYYSVDDYSGQRYQWGCGWFVDAAQSTFEYHPSDKPCHIYYWKENYPGSTYGQWSGPYQDPFEVC
jgi:hypothetical protein